MALELFLAVSALYGGVLMIWDNRLGMLDEWLDGTPFTTWTIPGILLIAIIAVPMSAVATLEAGQHRWAPQSSIPAGAIQIGWIGAQLAIMQRYNVQQPLVMGIGLAIILVTLWVHRDMALGQPVPTRPALTSLDHPTSD